MGKQESNLYNIAMTLRLLTAHKWDLHLEDLDLPGGSDGKESACHAGDSGSIPGLRKFPHWQPTPVFLPGEFYGQRSLTGYSPWGHKELDMIKQLRLSLFFQGNVLKVCLR